mmetsp:Transcript_62040/g.128383  ORF Transcript_62040/g.128383 Transcript_62040/m.128383 type:complete len:218 (+) Transcript_62040:2776-3429(+)
MKHLVGSEQRPTCVGPRNVLQECRILDGVVPIARMHPGVHQQSTGTRGHRPYSRFSTSILILRVGHRLLMERTFGSKLRLEGLGRHLAGIVRAENSWRTTSLHVTLRGVRMDKVMNHLGALSLLGSRQRPRFGEHADGTGREFVVRRELLQLLHPVNRRADGAEKSQIGMTSGFVPIHRHLVKTLLPRETRGLRFECRRVSTFIVIRIAVAVDKVGD